MKRFFTIVLFLIIALCMAMMVYDGLNLWLIRHSPSDTSYKMERFFDAATQDDIVILGSSRAICNYAPSVLTASNSSLTCFNYGINGSGIRETLFLLKEVLKRKKGGLVLVNLDPWGGAFYGDRPTSGFQGNYLLAARPATVRKVLPDGLVKGVEWIPGMRFQGLFRKSLTGYLNARKAVMLQIDHGATLVKQWRSVDEWRTIAGMVKPISFVPPSLDAIKDLEEINELANQFDAPRVVWVVAPCTQAWTKCYTGNDELAEFLSKRSSINLFSLSGFTLEEFKDQEHFNISGAMKFSSILAQRILALKPKLEGACQ